MKSNSFIYKLIIFFVIITNMGFAQKSFNGNPIIEDSLFLAKHGGLCFRIDDNSRISDYMKMAEIFNKYNAKFCIALNLNDFRSPDYKDSIKILQDMGHEIMDHTPNHRTNYFKTKFPISQYYTDSIVNPILGVDHIVGNKICLEFADVDTSKADRSGICDIEGNIIYDEFSNFSGDDIYIYFPKIKKLALLDSVAGNKISIKDVWEDEIDLGVHWQTEYYILNRFNIGLTKDALIILGNESMKLANEFNLKAPKVWIQPGGRFPQIDPIDVKNAIGDGLNYTAGSTYINGRKVYNEYDPNGSQKFQMQWGDFFEDNWTLKQCKNIIADRIAKHYMLIGHSHFFEMTGSLDEYFNKVDSLLAWANENNIPVKTYSEWADILYKQKPDPYVNVFPPLNIDLDKNISVLDINGVPDGYVNRYWAGQGQWEIDTVAAGIGKYCFTISGASRICRVDDLAGIEKGKNDFKIQTKGELGDSIEVLFTYGKNSTNPDQVYKFPADTKEWKEYSLAESTNGNTELIIPENESFVSIDIKCSNYISGKVKISGMYLAKSKLTSIGNQESSLPEVYKLSQNYPNPFNPTTTIHFSIPDVKSQNKVSLKIYDILGREIRTLVNEVKSPGNYEVTFDASQLSSGIYFYSLNAGNFIQTKKMILMK